MHICLTSVAYVEGLTDSSIWIVDLACTSHMTFGRPALLNYRQITSHLRLGTKVRATTAVIEDIIINSIIKITKSHIKFFNVVHTSNFRFQLISFPKITEHRGRVILGHMLCTIEVVGRTVAFGSTLNNLFYIYPATSSYVIRSAFHVLNAIPSGSRLQLWHHRLSNVHKSGIVHMAKNGVVTGLNLKYEEVYPAPCHSCIYYKGKNSPIPKAITICSTALLEKLIRTYVMGPTSIPSVAGPDISSSL